MLLALALVNLLHSILPIPLILFILDFDFFTTYKAYVLSEALAQALLILLAACLLVYLYRPWRWLLPSAALLASLAILTRPSSAYGLILLAAILLWALLKDFKRCRFFILASIFISAALLFSYIGALYLNFGKWTLAPISFYQRMGTALIITQPDDVNLMPDSELQQYYHLIQQGIADYGFKSKFGVAERILEFDTNIYRIALPAAHEMAARGTHYREDDLLDQTASRIIASHPQEYVQLGWDFFVYAWNDSRFNLVEGGLGLVLTVIFTLSALLRDKTAYAALALTLTHLTNLFISAFFGIPLVRYTRLTEILLLLSLWILFEGALARPRFMSRFKNGS